MPTLYPVPEIAIGAGLVQTLGKQVASLPNKPRRAIIVMDAGLIAGGLVDKVTASLKAADLASAGVIKVSSEPTIAQVDAAVASARVSKSEAVIGLGGGSALDLAKLVAALAPSGETADHYQLGAHPFPAQCLPSICLPSTAGTGSEATWTAVHTNSAGKKVWSWGPELAATKIVLDADLTATLPSHLMAATGLDALVHAIEACTNKNAFDYNTLTGLAAIGMITAALPLAVDSPATAALAREHLLVASSMAGTAINNCGTAIAHTIAHALGSLGKIHHGRAAALGLRASLPWAITHNVDAFARVAEAMGGPRDAAALPDLMDALIRKVGVKIELKSELPGITAERLAAEMALPENAAMLKATARPASPEDLLALARAVLTAV